MTPVDAVLEHGTLTASEVADIVGSTPDAVRHHLRRSDRVHRSGWRGLHALWSPGSPLDPVTVVPSSYDPSVGPLRHVEGDPGCDCTACMIGRP